MTSPRPDQVLEALLDGLQRADVSAVLLGGYAVVAWGVPRATFDVDVMVQADDSELVAALEVLAQRGFAVDPIYLTGWRDRIRDMPLVKVHSFRDGRAITSDVFLVTTPFQRSAFDRSAAIHLPGVERALRVVSPADLLLFKLLANRPKDHVDVQNVLTVQGVPEPDYLRSWAQRLRVGARLERALREAGLAPPPE